MISKTDFKRDNYSVEDLRDIVRILREPDGCPWDAEQTHKSVRNGLLEEAYEVADAITIPTAPHCVRNLAICFCRCFSVRRLRPMKTVLI